MAQKLGPPSHARAPPSLPPHPACSCLADQHPWQKMAGGGSAPPLSDPTLKRWVKPSGRISTSGGRGRGATPKALYLESLSFSRIQEEDSKTMAFSLLFAVTNILCKSYGMVVQWIRNRAFQNEAQHDAHFLEDCHNENCDTDLIMNPIENVEGDHTTKINPCLMGHNTCDESLSIELCDAFFDLTIPWIILKDGKRKPCKRMRHENCKEKAEAMSWAKENSTPEQHTEKHGMTMKQMKVSKTHARSACIEFRFQHFDEEH